MIIVIHSKTESKTTYKDFLYHILNTSNRNNTQNLTKSNDEGVQICSHL
jgi:hypothetical protein